MRNIGTSTKSTAPVILCDVKLFFFYIKGRTVLRLKFEPKRKEATGAFGKFRNGGLGILCPPNARMTTSRKVGLLGLLTHIRETCT